MRDTATPALLIALVALACLFAGALPAGPFPTSPAAFVDAACFLLAAWVAVVLPSVSGGTPLAVVESVLVAIPFLAFGARSAPSTPALPVAGLALAITVGLVATASPKLARRRIAILSACVLGLVPLLSSAGVRSVPPGVAAWVSGAAERSLPAAEGARVAAEDLLPDSWRSVEGALTRRPGALAPAPPPSAWSAIDAPVARSGSRWLAVPSEATASLPVRGPVVLVLGSPGFSSAAGDAVFVPSMAPPTHALDLDAFDAALLLPRSGVGGASEDPAVAEALASFARRGGLLIGPVHAAEWPLGLDRPLGEAGASVRRGIEGVEPFGVGRLARAQSSVDVLALVHEGLAQPRLWTAFDRAVIAPSSPLRWSGWEDDPASRTGTVPLLALFALAAAAAGLWRGARRGVSLALLTALACIGLGLVSSRPIGVRVQAFALDLGGAGGRRVEGLFLSAGPDGWVQEGPLRAAGGLRVLGFDVVRADGAGRLALPPGRDGWIVAESISLGANVGVPVVAEVPAWAATLLRRGDSNLSDLAYRAGRAPYRGPTVGGIAAPEAVVFVAESLR